MNLQGCINLIALLFFTVLVTSCNSTTEDLAKSPVFSPKESMEKMELEEGFEIELVAAEPLLNSPTAMTFDELGRI